LSSLCNPRWTSSSCITPTSSAYRPDVAPNSACADASFCRASRAVARAASHSMPACLRRRSSSSFADSSRA
jgi:hypothetical protein